MVIKVILAIFISLMISFCISLWRRRTMRKKLYEAASIISGPTFFSTYNHIANDMRGLISPIFCQNRSILPSVF